MDKRFDRLESSHDRVEKKLDEFILSREPIRVDIEKRVSTIESEMSTLDHVNEKIDLILSKQIDISSMLAVHDTLHKRNSEDLSVHILGVKTLKEIVEQNRKTAEEALDPIKKTHDWVYMSIKVIAGLIGFSATCLAIYDYFKK